MLSGSLEWGTMNALTVTSMKGGVGKTTIAALLARYIADKRDAKVLIVDMDPQGGASSILLGGTIEAPTIYDVLQMEHEGNPSGELLVKVIRRSRYHEQILVAPATANLAALGHASHSSDLLKCALENAPLQEDLTIIIDTGSMPTLVAQGIAAAQGVLIPVMLSQQTARPTINTLKLALNHHHRRGALIPIGIGKTRWEARELAHWTQQLRSSPALLEMGFNVLPGMPYSKIIVRGQWRYGKFPKRFELHMEAICGFFFSTFEAEPPHRKLMTEQVCITAQAGG
jgi:cellulose biosynthesis protein BcsQ